jgi:hypothetical protein
MTVDMGKFGVLATFRQLLPSPPMGANPAATFFLDTFLGRQIRAIFGAGSGSNQAD